MTELEWPQYLFTDDDAEDQPHCEHKSSFQFNVGQSLGDPFYKYSYIRLFQYDNASCFTNEILFTVGPAKAIYPKCHPDIADADWISILNKTNTLRPLKYTVIMALSEYLTYPSQWPFTHIERKDARNAYVRADCHSKSNKIPRFVNLGYAQGKKNPNYLRPPVEHFWVFDHASAKIQFLVSFWWPFLFY